MSTVGSRIKEERIARGWTQEELAKRCGYTGKSPISKIETAGNKISAKKIQLIASALDVSIPYLMGGTSQPNVQSLPEEEDLLIIAYHNAPESRREAVRALLGMV